jgi:hypothetical protein
MQIHQEQFDQIGLSLLNERIDQALHRTVPEYRLASDELRSLFLVLAIDEARLAGFTSEQGIAAYALGAWYLEPGFQSRSKLLSALFASRLPEFRRLYAMDAWLHAVIGHPDDLAAADDELRKAFDRTHAWGTGDAYRH